MALTKYNICSRALLRIGAKAITAFDDSSSSESVAAGKEYEPLVSEVLGSHRWRFAAKQFLLNRLTTGPLARWTYAYQIPGDCLVLHAVTRNATPVLYDRYGDQIWTNEEDDVTADYTFRQVEALFPATFIKALTTNLEEVFGKVLRDHAIDDRRIAMAWQAARTVESQQQTTRRIVSSRLVSVRH